MVHGKKCFLSVLIATLLLAMGIQATAQDSKQPAKKICSSQPGTDFPFPKGNELRILQYHEPTRTYYIESVRFPGEGNSIVTVETLINGVKEIRDDQERIRQYPKTIIRKIYTNDADLSTLTVEERDARTGCVPDSTRPL